MTNSIPSPVPQRDGLPADMRILLKDYPREAWPDHPNFAESVQGWMGAHQMFRRLGDIMRENCETYLDKNIGSDRFVSKLSYYGNALVGNLHGHHHWEDHNFFPELMKADQRFNAGIEMLESDHVLLNETLDRFTNSANRVIKLSDLDENQALGEVGDLHQCTLDIEAFLARHLGDEEDLVVPIILHHKLRG